MYTLVRLSWANKGHRPHFGGHRLCFRFVCRQHFEGSSLHDAEGFSSLPRAPPVVARGEGQGGQLPSGARGRGAKRGWQKGEHHTARWRNESLCGVKEQPKFLPLYNGTILDATESTVLTTVSKPHHDALCSSVPLRNPHDDKLNLTQIARDEQAAAERRRVEPSMRVVAPMRVEVDVAAADA